MVNIRHCVLFTVTKQSPYWNVSALSVKLQTTSLSSEGFCFHKCPQSRITTHTHTHTHIHTHTHTHTHSALSSHTRCTNTPDDHFHSHLQRTPAHTAWHIHLQASR